MKKLQYINPIFIIVSIGILLRLILLPFAQVFDADAVTRVFMAQKWWDNPILVTEGLWPPLHQYFYGLVFGISGDYQTTPILVSILISSLSVWPMYLFVKGEFNESFQSQFT